MKRTTRNLITALCCTGLLAAAGCSNVGELTVSGQYGSQGQALSGDRCDEILMDAANADTAEDQDAAQEEYRECVEDALEEDGHDAECRDRDDQTCDVILDEVGDALDRLREEADQNEAPDCSQPDSNGEEALCHLMAAYEACELDRDNDGDPDVDRPDEDDPNRPGDDDEADRPDDENGEGGDADAGECQEARDVCADASAEDCEHVQQNNPDCFDEGGANSDTDPDQPDENGEESDDPNADETDPNSGGDDNTDAFCTDLEEQIVNCDNDQERVELEEIHDRECTI